MAELRPPPGLGSEGRRVAVNLELKCRYAYKNCMNERTQKDNGELHSLCEYHRIKANIVQKKYARKRRNRKRQERLVAKASAEAVAPSSTSRSKRRPRPPVVVIDPIPYHHSTSEDEDKVEVDDATQNSLTNDDVEMLRDLNLA
ncbi:unnamed protein product [Aphanomyces euteiches]|uniref:Uncharacterized protein n=1 Tax=Aphanomyces euteiches TaxID=100861 RepID=A0A6G0W5A3_9STRA|nr:hypothetical protein Ae201684_018482 [Aphanomyces euteiches]KAH9072732.1 hypothetical protein Ae201684P_015803 [Aphanomyces euteiches]